jgi:TonB family protein
MVRVVTLLATALITLPQLAKCEKAIKGQGPILVQVLPDYPYEARDQRLEGSGLYRLHIKADGTVSTVTILKSTGHGLLDRAAIHAYRQWRFKQGALRTLRIPVTFTMKGVTY